MRNHDGGPAFPQPIIYPKDYGLGGMSLRDWFAGHALAGFCATSPDISSPATYADKTICAKWAYRYADAMLTERIKGETSSEPDTGEAA